MREEYALRYFGQLMPHWAEKRLNEETGWLRRMSVYKFDGYQDFVAGERFLSAFIRWLSQFGSADREMAYDLVRHHLVFLSPSEIQHLVHRTVPAHFRPILIERVARELAIRPYEVWSTKVRVDAYHALLRRSLFVGLSDGARMDVLRRANVGVLSNEQIAISYELSARKLDSLVKDLRAETKDPAARFEMVFLIDDFLGSGTTLCRQNKELEWKGKISRFGEPLETNHGKWFGDAAQIVVHHYIATSAGLAKAKGKLTEFAGATANPFLATKSVTLTAGLELQNSGRFPKGAKPELDDFLLKYYDPAIMTKSLWEGGCEVHNGFADGGLVLVLEHNTPNNSLAVLWAESGSNPKGPAMAPLFRRRQRHD